MQLRTALAYTTRKVIHIYLYTVSINQKNNKYTCVWKNVYNGIMGTNATADVYWRKILSQYQLRTYNIGPPFSQNEELIQKKGKKRSSERLVLNGKRWYCFRRQETLN